jgi:hypothetical protein
MSRGWAASGRKAAPARGPRPEGSFSLAVDRARRWWDDLTGRPEGTRPTPYSDVAAAAILSTAVALWADAAASMAGPDAD